MTTDDEHTDDEHTDAAARPTPPAEVDIDADLVTALLSDQHPDLAHLVPVELANGWDNVLYRLGDDLVVRLPRRLQAAALIEHEQRWLPVLAERLPLPVPVPVRTGRPGRGFPWAWSVQPWFPGRPAGAAVAELDGPAAARDLGVFLAALHRAAPDDAPANPFRGVALAERDDGVRERLGDLGSRVDGPALLARWEQCLAAEPWGGPPLWLHGDLHAHNLVADRGLLVAVIDFGDLTSGDPATDLAVAWSLLDPADHPAFRAAADTATRPIDEAMWRRAEGWALAVGLAVLAHSADSPSMAEMARRMLHPHAGS